jgi:hypothetical protein
MMREAKAIVGPASKLARKVLTKHAVAEHSGGHESTNEKRPPCGRVTI